MNTITLNEIISESDDIAFESSLNVMNSLFKEYDKITTISDYCAEGLATPSMFFQEGSIMDEATGKHTNDSTFWKIVAFIPRFIIALFKAMINAVTNSNGHEKDHEKATANLANASPEQLAEWSTSVNEETKGNIQFDPKKKVFFLAKPFRHIRNILFIVTGLPAVFTSIKQMIKNDNNEYKSILKNLTQLLLGKKEFNEETIQLTMDGLSKLLDDSRNVSKAMVGISDEIGMKLSEKIKKDFENGGDPSDKIAAQQLLLKIKDAGDKIYVLTTFHKLGIKIRAKIAGWGLSKATSDKGDHFTDARADAKAQIKALKAERKGLRGEERDMKYAAAQTAKYEKKLNKQQEKVAKQQQKLENQRLQNNETSQKIDNGWVPKKRFLGWGQRHQY